MVAAILHLQKGTRLAIETVHHLGRDVCHAHDIVDANFFAQTEIRVRSRAEFFAVAQYRIHFRHGGERSGTVDEPVRHAISKLAHLHFVATDESQTRLVRMGEVADRISVVGAPGLDDLKRRLAATRWPARESVADWSQGVPLAKIKALTAYWQSGYDLRRIEKRLNAFPQYRNRIDGIGIHFLPIRSKHENALPIVLTHGWPGSVMEFLKVIGPLTK